jgi:alkaline phosphatase D
VYSDTEDMQFKTIILFRNKILNIYIYGVKIILGTWDDHDYGANDAGEEYPYKRKSAIIFRFFRYSKDAQNK